MPKEGPKIQQIRALSCQLSELVQRTPVIRCAALEALLGGNTEIFAKLEFLQVTGTFKARGALSTLHSMSADELRAGVTAVSAGNHAIATAFAAQAMGTSAKVVMIRAANPSRVDACRSYGAEIVLADDVHQAFELVEQIRKDEGRYFVHPFEGAAIALGTGTVGLEVCEQVEQFDAALIPVGGGGLISGMSNAIKQLRPDCEVIGIEPEGADSMHRSFASGRPEAIDKVNTIADSLGAPFAMPFSFELARRNVDRLAMINDPQIREAMGFLFQNMKMAVEPACATTTAALLGPLRSSLCGKRIVLTMCGSNIDWATFEQQVTFDAVA